MKSFEAKGLALHTESGEVLNASNISVKQNRNAEMLTVRYDVPSDSLLELVNIRKFTFAGKVRQLPSHLVALEPAKNEDFENPPRPENTKYADRIEKELEQLSRPPQGLPAIGRSCSVLFAQ